MFERFTDRARKIMALANQEAQNLNHEYIGTEHIFLGMIKEGNGVAGHVLKEFDINLKYARNKIAEVVKRGPNMVTMGKLPQTPNAKKLIEEAIEIAHTRGEDFIGTEHLLLGLVLMCKHEEITTNHVIWQILLEKNIIPRDIEKRVLFLLDSEEEPKKPKELSLKQKIKRIIAWQRCDFVHQLTCGGENCSEVLIVASKNNKPLLLCPECNYEQEYIPEVVFHFDCKKMSKFIEDIKEGKFL